MRRLRIASNVVFYGVAVVLIAGALAVLWHLQKRFERDLEANVEGIQRVFSDDNVLKTPSDPLIRFASVEELARKYENHGYFGAITVSKYFGTQERVVHPFFLPAFEQPEQTSSPLAKARLCGHPLPGVTSPDVRCVPLRLGNQLLGNLYVCLDTTPLKSVRLAIISLSGLLVGAVALLAMQFRRQERVISRTTVELEEKRRELVRLERLALAGQLSANVFHDLKKPVLNIKNEIEELRDLALDTLPVEGFSAALADRRIEEQVNLFFGILRESNLERFVRAEEEREFVDVNEILERSIALVRYERGAVQLKCQFDPALPPLLAEPVRLVQVFSNLILNAYQAMEGHGELVLATCATPASVTVSIADSGPGIPPGDLEKIFTPFFTTKPAGVGTGLGLYITHDIVREMGGEIRVSGLEKGTQFDVTLPVEQHM